MKPHYVVRPIVVHGPTGTPRLDARGFTARHTEWAIYGPDGYVGQHSNRELAEADAQRRNRSSK